MARSFQSADSARSSARIRRGQSTAGTRNVSIRRGKGVLTYEGTPVSRTGISPRRVPARAKRVEASLRRIRKAFADQRIEGPGIDAGESKFYRILAKDTGLDARALAAQGTQEGGADEDYNVLNIGRTGSGDLPISTDPRFQKPKSGAKLTANFIRGIEGGASQIIRSIAKAKGKGPEATVRAFGASDWSSADDEGNVRRILPTIKAKSAKPKPGDLRTIAKAGIDPAAVKVKRGEAPAKPVPRKQITKLKAAKQAMKAIDKEKLPYVWGGGHVEGTIPRGVGLDCSGATRAVLQRAGLDPGPTVAADFMTLGKPGKGVLNTYANEGHVLMSVMTKKGEKFWGTSDSNPGDGAGWIPREALGEDYLSGFVVRHIPGLGKKTAAGLGMKIATAAGGSPSAVTGLGAANHSSAPAPSRKKPKARDQRKERMARIRAAYGGSADVPKAALGDLVRASQSRTGSSRRTSPVI